MEISPDIIRNALRAVKYPGYSRDIVSFGLVKEIHAHEGHIAVTLELTTTDEKIAQALKPAVEEALRPYEASAQIDVYLSTRAPTVKAAPAAADMRDIRHKIAIASGKGGVGKTTVAVNLAYALQAAGATVGLLDCDIYGPTVPLMLGASGTPEIEDGKLVPFESHGLKVMSMGLLIDETTPVVWRGPMITKTIQQFATQVNWGVLDYLIIDLPPGTGDAQLTLAQTIPLTGAIIVTTPQLAATQVAKRGASMFAKVNVPILGVVENMSYLVRPDGSRDTIFGSGGGQTVADALAAPLLAQIPLDSALRAHSDAGTPIMAAHSDSTSAQMYADLAAKVVAQMASKVATV